MAPLKRPLRGRAAAMALLVSLALPLGLAGCVPATEPERVGPAREENFQQPEVPPQLVPGGTADENLPFFTEVLRQFSVGAEPVEGQPLVNALVAAGFEKSAMQVSFDRSKTGLVADSILVSVLIDSDCLIGQVVTADRSYFSSVEPGLTASRSVCLIGNTRPIDW